MVISHVGRGDSEKIMATGPERSKLLHNFSLPPLKWANQRFLRCMKVNCETGNHRRALAPFQSGNSLLGKRYRDSDLERKSRSPNGLESKSPVGKLNKNGGEDDDGGIEAVRQKLMLDLKTETEKIKDAILRKGEEETPAPAVVAEGGTMVKPWNLRTRRAACKAPGGNGNSSKLDDRKTSFSPMRTDSAMRSPMLRAFGDSVNGAVKKERVKFSSSLSRKEVSEDFMAMVGERPPRRPKKRAKIVQRQLDSLLPGLYLTEVNAEIYKVAEIPDSRKR